nr:MAG: replication associated protein [Cressdnaviricota sp.]
MSSSDTPDTRALVILDKARSRRFTLTLNNYSIEDLNMFTNFCDTMTQNYIIGLEIGASGTPHIQAYLDFKNARYRSSLSSMFKHKPHIELARGSVDENYIYCSKKQIHKTNISPPIKTKIQAKYANVIWKDWQKEIIDLIETEPDSRTIYWYTDYIGNLGKSFLTKYLYITYDIEIVNGKATDIFNCLRVRMEKSPNKTPKAIIVDVPRCMDKYISYQAIEKIKDGLVYSGKYEGGTILLDDVHIIVFSNSLPEQNQMSNDRWKIKELNSRERLLDGSYVVH